MAKNIKSKLFLSWVLSYIIIAFFPVLIGSFVYVKSVETIHHEVTKMEFMTLEQLKSILDGKFEELDKTISNITLNQDIKLLMSLQKPFEPKDILRIINAQKDLSKFVLSNSNIVEIYVYLNNEETIFTSAYKYNSQDIEEICKREFFLSYDEFMQLVSKKNYRYFRILKSDTADGTERTKIVLMQSLYLNSLSNPSGTVIISLDGNKFTDLLKNLELTEHGEIILVNSKNEYFSTGSIKAVPDYLDYDLLKQTDVTFYNKWNGMDTVITHLSSDTLDIEYVSLIPSKIFLSKVQYIKNIIYVYICICLIAGGIAAFFLAKRNFSPVANLKQMVVNALGKSENQGLNEFKFIENSFKGLLDENRSIADNLRKQRAALRNIFLSRLLKGRIGSGETVEESLKAYEIEFSGEYFVVAAFSIEDPEGMLFPGNEEDEEAINIVYSSVKSIAEGLMNEKHKAYMVETDGLMALIINSAENMVFDKDGFKDDVCYILEKTVNFARSELEIVLSAFVSDVHYGLHGIRQAYSETLQILEYKMIIGEESTLIRYDSINKDIADDFSGLYNLDKERLFVNCIEAGDYKGAKEILDEMLVRILDKNVNSIQLMKCRVFGLINMILNAIGEIRSDPDMHFVDGLDPTNRLLNSKTVMDLKKEVDLIFNRIMEYHSEKAGKQVPEWVTQVDDYIGSHFHENDLSIISISNDIGLSVSYLSRAYKRYKKIGLLDYIHKVRLEKAKELLKMDICIKDIAQQVGYLDSKALIRAFRRYEGITPGKYKEAVANQTGTVHIID